MAQRILLEFNANGGLYKMSTLQNVLYTSSYIFNLLSMIVQGKIATRFFYFRNIVKLLMDPLLNRREYLT